MSYPATPMLSLEAPQDRLTLVEVSPDEVRFAGAVGGEVSPPPPPLVVYVNELTARPVPPIHGSNPACTLVRYQLRWAKPRLIASA